jgi:phosphoglycerate dehydrogenase-like enzyme
VPLLLFPQGEFVDDLRAERAAVDVAEYDASSPPSAAALEDVQFLVAPYSSDLAALDLVEHMPRLQVLQLLTSGYERALRFRPPGVTLCHARGVHDTSVAELALTLTLAAQRGIPGFVQAQGSGRWSHARRPSLADRRVLLLGYGEVARALETRLVACEADVVRVASVGREDPRVHPVGGVLELLPDVDVVIVTVPLTEATAGLVDAAFLARLPDGALLVNVGRGAVVDTDALVTELATGRIRAALDVTEPEPLPADHPLWSFSNALVTPHVGGNSTAFLPRARAMVLSQALRFLDGEEVENVVAAPD